VAARPYDRPVALTQVQEQVARRVLWAATAVVLVAGVLSAPVVGARDDGEDIAATSPSATSSTAGPGGAAGGDATVPPAAVGPSPGAPSTAGPGGASPGAPTTQARGGSGSDGAAPPTAPGAFRDLGPVDDPGATAAPAAGAYPYRFTDDTGEARDATTKVEDRGSSSTGARRLVIAYSGEGLDIVNDALWGPQEVRYTKTTFAFGDTRTECDWEPDYLQMPLNLSRGRTWEARSSCTVQLGPTASVINRTTTSRVVEGRRVHVAGSEVLTWLVETNDRLEYPGQGAVDNKETSWFAPKLGLFVRQVGEQTSSDPEDEKTRSELVITRLTPS
jgi:hypothetical protein